jgi:hypothetical protein
MLGLGHTIRNRSHAGDSLSAASGTIMHVPRLCFSQSQSDQTLGGTALNMLASRHFHRSDLALQEQGRPQL